MGTLSDYLERYNQLCRPELYDETVRLKTELAYADSLSQKLFKKAEKIETYANGLEDQLELAYAHVKLLEKELRHFYDPYGDPDEYLAELKGRIYDYDGGDQQTVSEETNLD